MEEARLDAGVPERAGRADPISDAQMLAAWRRLRTRDVRVVTAERLADDTALVRFVGLERGLEWEVELPLPSSTALKPWLYRTPDDADDAASMLGVFLDEEVGTRAVEVAARTSEGRLILAPYGFELADRAEHERLARAAGPDGWNGRVGEGGPFVVDVDDDPASRRRR